MNDSEALWSGPQQASRRLVLLHGWGADADDLLDLGELLVGPHQQRVALRAPLPHPAGTGRQWYDLQQNGWPQLPGALVDLRRRLLDLHQSVPLEHTVLLGFSQGAAMALNIAAGTAAGTAAGRTPGGGGSAAEPLPVAGVVACSGYPHPGWEPAALAGRTLAGSPDLEVLLTHGEQDPVVPHGASVELQRLLLQAGANVELLSFSGGHTIDPDLFAAMRAFIERCWR